MTFPFVLAAGAQIDASCKRYEDAIAQQRASGSRDAESELDSEVQQELEFSSFFAPGKSSHDSRRKRAPTNQEDDDALLGENYNDENLDELPQKKKRIPGTNTGNKSRREAADEDTLQKCSKLVDEKSKQFADSELWETKLKRRAVIQMQKQVEQSVAKLEGIPLPASHEIISKAKGFLDSVLVKYDALQAVRKSGKDCVVCIDKAHGLALGTVAEDVVHRVIQFVATACLKTLDKDSLCYGFLPVLLGAPRGSSTFGS